MSDHEDVEVSSSTSETEEQGVEDAELQAVTQHLTQDFLCQVIQEEEEGRGKKTGDGKQELGPEKEGAGPQRQVPPLAVILGKLPSTSSLDLQQTFQTFSQSESGPEPDGKTWHLDDIRITSLTHHQVITGLLL